MEINNKTVWDLIELLSCALDGIDLPEEHIRDMDLSAVACLAEFHSVEAICAFALEAYFWKHQEENSESARYWKRIRERSIRKSMLLDAEREKILAYFEKEKIWFMPLKGCILKDYYPAYGMRQMADNDILYDASFQEQVREFMISQGYRAESVGKCHHDVYHKEPVYNFELHTTLVTPGHGEKLWEYYKNIREKLLPGEHKKCALHFTDEDFYLFVVVHAYKHYQRSGTGFRTLTDLYVFLKEKRNVLDWGYICTEAEKLGVAKFEKDIRNLSDSIFGNKACIPAELTKEQEIQLEEYVLSGTYGTMEQSVRKKLGTLQAEGKSAKMITKIKYLWRRLFPPVVLYGEESFYCRHKWASPIFWMKRIVWVLLTDRKRILQEVKYVKKTREI